MPPTFTCRGCGLAKPVTDYHKSANPSGHSSRCKPCHSALARTNRIYKLRKLYANASADDARRSADDTGPKPAKANGGQ